jgi:hypothetical protein
MTKILDGLGLVTVGAVILLMLPRYKRRLAAGEIKRGPKNGPGSAIRAAGLMLTIFATPVVAQGFTVPNGLEETDGNTEDFFPFGIVGTNLSKRFQQVYDASQFWRVSKGGQLFEIDFRVDSFFFPVTLNDVQITLSTTSKSPDGLSSVFSENMGPDATTVFHGSLNMRSLPAPTTFTIQIPLTTPFFYDPRLGNLLMDVRNYQGSSSYAPPFNAQNTSGDSVSCAYALSADAASATGVGSGMNTVGLVTLFDFAVLSIYQADFGTPTNHNYVVVIEWPSQPTNFALQYSALLGNNAFWTAPTNSAADSNNFANISRYSFPANSGGASGLYRLHVTP